MQWTAGTAVPTFTRYYPVAMRGNDTVINKGCPMRKEVGVFIIVGKKKKVRVIESDASFNNNIDAKTAPAVLAYRIENNSTLPPTWEPSGKPTSDAKLNVCQGG